MPAFNDLLDCLAITDYMLEHIQVKPNLLDDAKYDLLFSVERVNELVLSGISFREAYQLVGKEIAGHTGPQPSRTLHHTHEGSIGNLMNGQIVAAMDEAMAGFGADKAQAAERALLS